MHIMIDLETLSTDSNSVILSIGAVAFSLKEVHTKKTFYQAIDIDSCILKGLHISGSTVGWWISQSDEAKRVFSEKKQGIKEALVNFNNWLSSLNEEISGVWGNGATFDNVIIGNAFRVCNLKVPWHFSKDRCFRTFKALYPNTEVERESIHHNALDDTIWQATYMVETFKNSK